MASFPRIVSTGRHGCFVVLLMIFGIYAAGGWVNLRDLDSRSLDGISVHRT